MAIPEGEHQTEKAVPTLSEPALFFSSLPKASFVCSKKNKADASLQPFLSGWKMGLYLFILYLFDY
jgi:hypothetical protein